MFLYVLLQLTLLLTQLTFDLFILKSIFRHNLVRPAKGLEEIDSVNDGNATLLAEENETDLDGAYAERRNGLPSVSQTSAKSKQLNSPDLNISLNIEDIARRRENEENGL